MCGIVGIIGKKPAVPLLLEGLKRLEYRGYDSAGIATLDEGAIHRRRAEGKIVNLQDRIDGEPLAGTTGIGHTRWATHGEAVERNAHPHATDKVALVHNGIIENYKELRAELEGQGAQFTSDTDTEVVVHLLTRLIEEGQTPQEATKQALKKLRGAFSLAIIFTGHERLMIGARRGTPLAIGYGDGEMFLASDSYALAPLTSQVCFLEDGDWVEISHDKAIIYDETDTQVDREVKQSAVSGVVTGKGEYRHFMQKEIFEQPAVIGDTLNTFIHPSTGVISLPQGAEELADITRLTISACGTAFYTGLVGRHWLENIAQIPVSIDVASEFRYRNVPLMEGGAALFVSQSGETLDTLEALRYCKRNKQKIACVVNTLESTIERESDIVLRTMAGPEIGVASTKAFTTQLTVLACMTLALARKRGTISQEREAQMADALREVPARAADILNHDEQIQQIAHEIHEAKHALYLGRGTSFALAMEGALKLKEISYIHAEGYAAGEMKHGPIALIDEQMPVVAIAPNDELFEKTASNVKEVVARGGKVLLISDKKGCEMLAGDHVWSVEMPDIDPFVAPILYAIPIQLLAYHTAVLKGTDVDQPRNLAKSVTVE